MLRSILQITRQVFWLGRQLLHGEDDTPVFEERSGRLIEAATGFEAWLTKRRESARRKYNNHEWDEIVAGTAPFTREEARVVEARRQFTCRPVGVTAHGRFLFEVHNGSDMTIPFLSISVRWKDNSLQGGIWLPVGHILPGQTEVVQHEVYKGIVDPSRIEVSLLPDPEPEDRERFWEFRALSV